MHDADVTVLHGLRGSQRRRVGSARGETEDLTDEPWFGGSREVSYAEIGAGTARQLVVQAGEYSIECYYNGGTNDRVTHPRLLC